MHQICDWAKFHIGIGSLILFFVICGFIKSLNFLNDRFIQHLDSCCFTLFVFTALFLVFLFLLIKRLISSCISLACLLLACNSIRDKCLDSGSFFSLISIEAECEAVNKGQENQGTQNMNGGKWYWQRKFVIKEFNTDTCLLKFPVQLASILKSLDCCIHKGYAQIEQNCD